MVSVKLRFNGEGTWRTLALPVTPELAQTMETAARRLGLGDLFEIVAAGEGPGGLDLRV